MLAQCSWASELTRDRVHLGTTSTAVDEAIRPAALSGTVRAMTTHPDDELDLSFVLQVYADEPMDDGDVVLLLDSKVCVEIEQLADEWDAQLCRNTAHILKETAGTAVLAIARAGASLTPSDYRLWRDLHQELRDSRVDLKPLLVLPAA